MTTEEILDATRYAAREQARFKKEATETGFECRTTFYADLSFAERLGGALGVKEMYNKIVEEWLGDVEAFTEFVICLNWKAWQWHRLRNERMVHVYSYLYERAEELATGTFDAQGVEYFLNAID